MEIIFIKYKAIAIILLSILVLMFLAGLVFIFFAPLIAEAIQGTTPAFNLFKPSTWGPNTPWGQTDRQLAIDRNTSTFRTYGIVAAIAGGVGIGVMYIFYKKTKKQEINKMSITDLN